MHRCAALSTSALLVFALVTAACGETAGPGGAGGTATTTTTSVTSGGGGGGQSCQGSAGGPVIAPGGAGDPEALAALAHATIPLVDWRFAPDPGDEGEALGYASAGLDDAGWAPIVAGKSWEDQGYPALDGAGWYRRKALIPADLAPGPVHFMVNGADDEYDLWVDGQHAGHFGLPPDQSVYNRSTRIDIDPFITRGKESVLAVRVRDWGLGGGLWRSVSLRGTVPFEAHQHLLPEPVLDGDPDLVALYWKAWRLAWEKISFGNEQNHLVASYMGVGFDEHIYQWDSSFIALFGRYGARLFPVMPTLDNFYARQRPDGYIQRVYSETDGAEVGEPSPAEPLVNPPLFSWVEWEYHRFSGDDSRLAAVLPTLEAYHAWLRDNVESHTVPGLYRQSDLGSGMDNTPRGDVAAGAWIDMSAQQALAALYLSRIAGALGQADKQALWQKEHDDLAALIDATLWSEADGFYYDRTGSGALAGVKHIGGLWPLLAEVGDGARAERLVGHLEDPAEFKRRHVYPSLAASDPAYDPEGHYWRGSVWAPTNYMTITGLARRGYTEVAREAARNHLSRMVEVWKAPPTDEQLIAPDERDGDYATIWECYSPDSASPGTRWDATFYGRQDFVGWSGVGPIALLLEQVLGLDVRGAEGKVVWTVTRTDRHGVSRMPLGLDNEVGLIAAGRAGESAPLQITVEARRPFVLSVERPGREAVTLSVCAGTSSFEVP